MDALVSTGRRVAWAVLALVLVWTAVGCSDKDASADKVGPVVSTLEAHDDALVTAARRTDLVDGIEAMTKGAMLVPKPAAFEKATAKLPADYVALMVKLHMVTSVTTKAQLENATRLRTVAGLSLNVTKVGDRTAIEGVTVSKVTTVGGVLLVYLDGVLPVPAALATSGG